MSLFYIVRWRCTCRVTSYDLAILSPRYPTILGIATSCNVARWHTIHPRIVCHRKCAPKFTHRKSSYGVVKVGVTVALTPCRVPTDLENLEKSRRKIVARESQSVIFPTKSQGKIREFCSNVQIAVKVCFYSCRWSRQLTNMNVHDRFKVLNKQH